MTPGASMFGLGAGTFRDASSVAIGASSATQNGIVVKFSGTANTQGDYGLGAGIGWQF
nr:YadA C-terminal domain-containing protein [Shimwellia pseudoproteus]